MDLEKLEAGLREVQDRREQLNRTIRPEYEKREHKVGQDGYSAEDLKREMKAIYREQVANYNPRLVERPLLNEAIAAYEVVSAEERSAIRDIFGKFDTGLLNYIIECAECLESPKDEDIFRLAMIAASIENAAHDFRDTDMILAELAIAARNAGINIEPHCTAIAELSSAVRSSGGGLMKAKLASFHIYAPKAVRVVPYDWVNGVELPEDKQN
jgi:hypothetical protein